MVKFLKKEWLCGTKWSNMIREINLNTDKIELDNGKELICFFIVNNTCDNEYIKNLARRILPLGRWFYFYGLQEKLWHNEFDEEDINLKPQITDDNVALTCTCHNLEDFCETIIMEYDNLGENEELCFFYDDKKEYKEVVEQVFSIRIKENQSK